MNGSASLAFLPWLRRGIATEIARVDGRADGAPSMRSDVTVTVTFNNSVSAAVRIALAASGDVRGLDSRVVSRVYPAANTFDAVPNYFSLLELDQPDLPWRFTPARATDGDRLRPWLCLVVLADDEIVARHDSLGAGDQPSFVTAADARLLPRLDQAWAWAHVQVSGADQVDAAVAGALLRTEPARLVARLLCPRRLKANTRYAGFLVPTFERGRLTGLGAAVGDDVDALVPAWQEGDGQVTLPVYHWWRFGTGLAGDFEYLVRQLALRPLRGGVGARPLDVSAPASGLPPAADPPFLLEGALTPVRADRPPLADLRAAFVDALEALLNRAAALLRQPALGRVLGPPLYGRWYARRDTVGSLAPAASTWYDELNLDPRWRVAAGMGTRVIQGRQRELMASAWAQVGDIRAANERLRQAQLARAAARSIYDRHLVPGGDEAVVMVTTPLHAKILGSPMTIRAQLRASPIPDGTFEPQFRRVTRPLGPIGRRQGRAAAPTASNVLDRLNRGVLRSAPPPPTPGGLVTPRRAGFPPIPTWAGGPLRTALVALPRLLFALAVLLLVMAAVAPVAGVPATVSLVALVAAAAAYLAYRLHPGRALLQQVATLEALRAGTITPQQIMAIPAKPSFVARETRPAPHAAPNAARVATRAVVVAGDSTSAAEFRSAAAALATQIDAPRVAPPAMLPVQLGGVRQTLIGALDPNLTVARAVGERLRVATPTAMQPGNDPLEPPLAAPDFPRPMYEALRDVSTEWLLPGLDGIPPNTVALLFANQRFIESYMVGLNHEMARVLQWNGYPTDLRGTYFRQFWDTAGYVARPNQPIDAALLKDIRPIDAWGDTALGSNSARVAPPGGDHLVLLIRGDVLQRYPNTMLYAVRARRGGGGVLEFGDETRSPVFSGVTKPDVCFFGFELTAAEARGTADPESNDQGWFFVLQEQPSELRFGLDASAHTGGSPGAWRDLAWGHLAATDADLRAIDNIDLDADLPDTSGIGMPPGVAWHADHGRGPTGARASDIALITMRRPTRVAIHGSNMLPPA